VADRARGERSREILVRKHRLDEGREVGLGLAWQQKKADDVDLAFFRINAGLGFVVLAVVLAGQGLPR
jgi:hypothetical protein